MLHALVSESEHKKLHPEASTAAVREPHASFNFDAWANHGSDHLADGQPLAASQTSCSNQATLKRLPFSFMPVLSNQSRLQMLERKTDCACGGQCGGCKGKKASFIGDLDDDVLRLAPDGSEATTQEAGSPATEAEPLQSGGGGCTSLCNRAYADPALNGGGGGVVCEKGVKCACVFDVAPLTRGQCPGFDAIVLAHETRHLPETDCSATAPLSRLGTRSGVDLTTVECTHRRESIREIDAILPGSAGICKTGMQSIRAQLDTWVKANCS